MISPSMLLVLLVMMIAAIQDVRKREVEPVLWLVAIPLGAAITLSQMSQERVIYLLFSLLPAAVSFVLYKRCMIGGADVLALLFIAIAAPWDRDLLVPPVYMIVLYSIVPSLAYQLYSNLLVCGGSASCLLSQSHEVEAGRLLRDQRLRWWIPEGEACSEEDPREVIARLSDGDESRRIKVMPGHPYVAHLAIGALLTLIFGDLPLRAMWLILRPS